MCNFFFPVHKKKMPECEDKGLSSSVQATMTKHWRQESLEEHLLLTVLETGKFKIKELAALMSDKDLLLGLLMAILSLCPRMAGGRERKEATL